MTTTPTQYVEQQAELAPLTGHDRCDRCGAEAFVRVQMRTGGDLVFCGHHYGMHEMELSVRAVRVRDERERINARPSVSANV